MSLESNPSRSRQRVRAILGLALNLGPIIGVFVSLLRLSIEFYRGAAATPNELAHLVEQALLSSGLGIVAGIAGVVLVTVSLFQEKLRERWFFMGGIVAGFLWSLLLFPLGLLPGLYLLISFFLKRPEFFPEAPDK